jgi:hypothetical protein
MIARFGALAAEGIARGNTGLRQAKVNSIGDF